MNFGLGTRPLFTSQMHGLFAQGGHPAGGLLLSHSAVGQHRLLPQQPAAAGSTACSSSINTSRGLEYLRLKLFHEVGSLVMPGLLTID